MTKTLKKVTIKKAPKPSGAVKKPAAKKAPAKKAVAAKKAAQRVPPKQRHQQRKPSKLLLKLTEPQLPQLKRPKNK